MTAFGANPDGQPRRVRVLEGAAAVILAGERPFDGPVTLTAQAAATFDAAAGGWPP